MPSCPIASPLNTEVMAKDTPVTVPTRPLALSRRSAGTRSVTQVDMTMPRRPPATEPIRISERTDQNKTLRMLSTAEDATRRKKIGTAASDERGAQYRETQVDP